MRYNAGNTAARIAVNAARSIAVGVVTGIFITFFANTVSFAGELNDAHPFLILLMPLGAFATYLIYRKLGEAYRRATVSAIDTIHDWEEGSSPIPRTERINPWMGAVAYIGAAISHFTGASVGKEGVGVQIGLSVGELFTRIERKLSWWGHRGREDYYLMCGAAAAFGSLFGSPITGVLFGMTFATADIIRLDALFPCLLSSYSAVLIAEMLGIHKMTIPSYACLGFSLGNAAIIIAFAALIGLLARLFIYLLGQFRSYIASYGHNQAMDTMVTSLIVLSVYIIIYLFTGTTEYTGLSLDLLYRAIDGTGVPLYAFIVKALLVFFSISAGFVGGEVVPLIVTGGTFGYAVASAAGFETAPFAVLGAIGMLSGGTNLPLVCFALGLELFGYTDARMLFLTVAFAYLTSGKTGIYQHQHMVLVDRLRGEDA